MNTNLTTILDKQNEQLHQMSKNLVLNFLQQYEITILKQLENDVIEMYSECTESEQYWDTYICEITQGIESDEWDTIR